MKTAFDKLFSQKKDDSFFQKETNGLMIQSILDNDLYKFTMQQAVHRLYPRAEVVYTFINRADTRFPEGFDQVLKEKIQNMTRLCLSPQERQFLERTCPYLSPVYLDFLQSYQYDHQEISISQKNGILNLNIKGYWYRTILWEVPLMALISESYFHMLGDPPMSEKERKLINLEKARALGKEKIKFADFGTRRRYSAKNHEQVLRDLLSYEHSSLIGTSNVHLAHKFKLKPIGTLAHEWFMFHAVRSGYKMANTTAQDAWVKVFRGDLGIALTDTFTTDMFLSTFDSYYARLFDGVRQDSGDPFVFTDKLIRHYEKLNIDPGSKIIVYSDGLDIEKILKIHQNCADRVRDSYGIGTNLSNDVGVNPLNMVVKMTECRLSSHYPRHKTVKLSDDKGKHTGDPEELQNCVQCINSLLNQKPET
jgi:nicotinate phosphoribosyltransferase